MSPGNPLLLDSKGQRSGPDSRKHCRRGSLHSCECLLLLSSFDALCIVVLALATAIYATIKIAD